MLNVLLVLSVSCPTPNVVTMSQKHSLIKLPYLGPWALTSDSCDITSSEAKLNWVEDKIMREANIQYWSELPIIVPPTENFRHFLNINTGKAIKVGLKIRPLEDTINPLLEWDRTRRNTPLKCGLPKEKEQLALKLAAKNRP